jgi:hypothetical protein
MINKEEFLKLIFYFAAAATASLIRFLRNEKKSFSVFMVEMLMGASFAFFVVPAIVDYYGWSLYYGTGITWLLTMLSESVLRKIESRINKKIDDVADNIDK